MCQTYTLLFMSSSHFLFNLSILSSSWLISRFFAISLTLMSSFCSSSLAERRKISALTCSLLCHRRRKYCSLAHSWNGDVNRRLSAKACSCLKFLMNIDAAWETWKMQVQNIFIPCHNRSKRNTVWRWCLDWNGLDGI